MARGLTEPVGGDRCVPRAADRRRTGGARAAALRGAEGATRLNVRGATSRQRGVAGVVAPHPSGGAPVIRSLHEDWKKPNLRKRQRPGKLKRAIDGSKRQSLGEELAYLPCRGMPPRYGSFREVGKTRQRGGVQQWVELTDRVRCHRCSKQGTVRIEHDDRAVVG